MQGRSRSGTHRAQAASWLALSLAAAMRDPKPQRKGGPKAAL